MVSSPRTHDSVMRARALFATMASVGCSRIVHPLTLEAQMTVTPRGAIAGLGIFVAIFLGFGAVEELVIRGIRGGEGQPLIIGVAGALVSLLLGLAALALWRQHRAAPRLASVAAVAAIAFHVYAALPPHR